MTYDQWITSGDTHRCPYCGSYWTDSDGGCECGGKDGDLTLRDKKRIDEYEWYKGL